MIANRRQEDSENNNGFIHDSESLAQDLDSNSLSSYRSVTSAVSAQKIPLMDWIQNGLMHKQMYRQKKEVLKRDTADMSLLMTDYDDYSLSSSSDDFTYPVEKVRKYSSETCKKKLGDLRQYFAVMLEIDKRSGSPLSSRNLFYYYYLLYLYNSNKIYCQQIAIHK